MNEKQKQEWTFKRAVGGGIALSIITLIISIFLWISAVNSNKFIHYFQASLVTIAFLFFGSLTLKTLRKKHET